MTIPQVAAADIATGSSSSTPSKDSGHSGDDTGSSSDDGHRKSGFNSRPTTIKFAESTRAGRKIPFRAPVAYHDDGAASAGVSDENTRPSRPNEYESHLKTLYKRPLSTVPEASSQGSVRNRSALDLPEVLILQPGGEINDEDGGTTIEHLEDDTLKEDVSTDKNTTQSIPTAPKKKGKERASVHDEEGCHVAADPRHNMDSDRLLRNTGTAQDTRAPLSDIAFQYGSGRTLAGPHDRPPSLRAPSIKEHATRGQG